MVEIHYSPKGTPYVWATELYILMNVEAPIYDWFLSMIEYGFDLNKDYSEHFKLLTDTNGNPLVKYEWAIQIDMAKHIAMVHKSSEGRKIREYLISLEKNLQDGKFLSIEQINALFEICKILGYFTIQVHLEKEHFTFFDQPKQWWQYRAKLLGYGKSDLKDMVEGIGIRYQNQRQALFHIDKYELIRIATIDLFIAMGKSEIYATNVSKFVKEMAKELKPIVFDDINLSLDFKSKQEKDLIQKIASKDSRTKLLSNF